MKKEQNQNASETRKKSYLLLIVGMVLLAAAIAFTVYAHGGSYAASLETGSRLSEVKAMVKSVEAGETAGDLEALKAQQAQLTDLKLSQERPYSYGLTALFFSLLLVAKGLYNALAGTFRQARKRPPFISATCSAFWLPYCWEAIGAVWPAPSA